ncbi:unnamed protein product [Candidula unifasciata]|uniref:Uncharacterized protein n=1 Tax=Candidula unifasciata TaxID=100452 RepID=A0A8S3YIX9_9EUPU|nr:unnamed protein product [Candidula unifasciata]
MQTRRKKYSLVDRPGGVPSPFGIHPISASPFGCTPGPFLGIQFPQLFSDSADESRDIAAAAVTSAAGVASGLMSDIDLVVSRDPGTSSTNLTTESIKSSEYINYEYCYSNLLSSCELPTDRPTDRPTMRLLVLEETERSQLMHKLVTAFQQNVLLCFDHYKPELTLYCLRIVTSLSARKPRLRSRNLTVTGEPETNIHQVTDPFAELDVEEALSRELPNFTVSKLRETVQQLLRRATLRQDGTLYFAGSPEESMATKSVQYFIWFFDFMDFLHELFVNFVEKIFNPLFKYFQDYNFLSSDGRTNSVSSAFSKLSQFSESDNQGSLDGDHEGSESESLAESRRMHAQAKASLLQLCKEYKDIKSIYDTTAIDRVAQRLSFVKEQLEYLLDEEDEVDPDLYSAESGKLIEHMNMDFGTENLIRLVPDILVKLKKAAWLARRWLELDDQRTKDVSAKLDKLAIVEKQLVKRLDVLHDDITKGEKKLERETNELNRLMEKEGRPDVLTLQSYNIDREIKSITIKLEQLNKEKETFAERLSEIVKAKNLSEFHKLKFKFESNKLQRFTMERKLATLAFKKNLLDDDLNIELFVRPSVIHSSNKLQDECERLEKYIRQQKEELVSIKRALLPVQEDKASLMNRLSRQRECQPSWHHPVGSSAQNFILNPGHAAYIRSLPRKPNQQQAQHTSLPAIQQVSHVTVRNQRNISPPSW